MTIDKSLNFSFENWWEPCDNRFKRGTSCNAEAGLDSCKKHLFSCFVINYSHFKRCFKKSENAIRWANDIRTNTCYLLEAHLLC